MTLGVLLRKPSAFTPLAMSLAALVLLMQAGAALLAVATIVWLER